MQDQKKGVGLDILLVVISICITLVAVEVAYRVYLGLTLTAENPFAKEEPKNPTISLYSSPGLWLFQEAYGFDYPADGGITASIVDGVFTSCGRYDVFNSRGNVATRETDFDAADVRGILIGSSYTMGPGPDGRLFHEIVDDALSERTGKTVLLENYSRDSYGLIQMMDMAATLATRHKPDFIIIAFNSAMIGVPRRWRTVKPASDGFWYFYELATPNADDLSVSNALVHRYMISDLANDAWCERMTKAQTANDQATLAADPVVRAAVERFPIHERTRHTPELAIDFTTIAASFVFNRIARGSAFWNMDVFKKNEAMRPLELMSYGEDEGFRQAVWRLHQSGVPYSIVHIPSFPEVETGEEWAALGTVGVPAARERSLVDSLKADTGHEILSLLPGIGAPVGNAASLAEKAHLPNRNWHPNKAGVAAFTKAMTDLIYTHHLSGEQAGQANR